MSWKFRQVKLFKSLLSRQAVTSEILKLWDLKTKIVFVGYLVGGWAS